MPQKKDKKNVCKKIVSTYWALQGWSIKKNINSEEKIQVPAP
jgi:hypothetical protein